MHNYQGDMYFIAPNDIDYTGIAYVADMAADAVVDLGHEVVGIAKAYAAVGTFAHHNANVSSDVARSVGTSISSGVTIAGQSARAVKNTLTNSWRKLTQRTRMHSRDDIELTDRDYPEISSTFRAARDSLASSSASITLIREDSASEENFGENGEEVRPDFAAKPDGNNTDLKMT